MPEDFLIQFGIDPTIPGLEEIVNKVVNAITAKPIEIKRHIKEAIDVLGSKEGGLMLYAECEPDVPLKNIETICEAFEEYGGPSV